MKMNKIISICGILLLFILLFAINAYPFWGLWGHRYIAKVNGEVITLEDFKDRLMEFHKSPEAVRDSSREFNYRRFLDKIIDERLMIQEAYRLELDKSPDFIKGVEAKEGLIFKGDKEKKDPNLRKRLERYKELQLINRFNKDIIYPMIKLTEDELRGYYENNKERFMRSDRVMLGIIEVKGEKEAKELRDEYAGKGKIDCPICKEGRKYRVGLYG
jgi:peptidyl-prolyl cis-trans isomerase C